MRLLVALVLMVVLISGCMESDTGRIDGNGVEKSAEELKNLYPICG